MYIIPHGTNINFFNKLWLGYLLSLGLIAYSFFLFFSTGSEKYGIDFVGGHEFVVSVPPEVKDDKIREALENGGIENAVVQSFEAGSNEYSIRLGGLDVDSKLVREKLENAIKASTSQDIKIIKTDYVGATVGEELKRNALYAFILGLLVVMAYIAYQFEFSFALGVVVAVFHDTIICFGVYLFFGYSISMGTIAAALTIVGYSINDTIVIFDRVREEIKKKNNYDLQAVMNESINLMLDRTLVTSLLTLFSALALYLYGGGAIADLSFFLVIGVLTGCYSTIYVACPIVMWWEKRRS